MSTKTGAKHPNAEQGGQTLTFPSFSCFSSSSGVRSGRIASATITGMNVSAALTTWIWNANRPRIANKKRAKIRASKKGGLTAKKTVENKHQTNNANEEHTRCMIRVQPDRGPATPVRRCAGLLRLHYEVGVTRPLWLGPWCTVTFSLHDVRSTRQALRSSVLTTPIMHGTIQPCT